MASLFCEKCGRTLDEGNFYTYKDGTKTELCKKCLTMHIDNFDPETFLWLLQKMDVPYIPEEWNVLRDKAYAKDPYKMNGMSVFGKYLSKMKLKQWSKYSWADTEKLKAESEERARLYMEEHPEIKAKQEAARVKFERGEISEAEYKTLTATETLNNERPVISGNPITGDMYNPFQEKNFMNEDEFSNMMGELTQEDKVYLAMKWGRLYQPSEWVELEKNYMEMMEGFDIQDPDTINTLKHICKINLKMNQAIDCGDIDGYQKLSRVYESLRKSAKFTAAQNKEKKDDFVDCIGNMVAYCEKVGGEIPKYEIKVELDIVDKVINDLKSYNRSLVYEDTSLARQIEDYIKKRENMDAMKRDKEEAKRKGLEEVQVEDEDIQEHLEMINKEKQADYEIVYGAEEEEG